MAENTTTAPIVVGVRDSETARRAAERARELAISLDAPLHLVTAVKSNTQTTIKGPGTDNWIIDNTESARRYLHDLAVEWDDVDTTTACPSGRPATVLIEEAERVGAELIVVGNHHMQGASRILGAVANDVAHHAPCDVYIAHTTD